MKRPLPAGQLWLVALLAIVLAACRTTPPLPPPATPTPPPELLTIGLASSAAGLADSLPAGYAGQTDRAALLFVTGNGAALLADLAGGQLDAVLIHHLPEGDTNWFNPVALDGLAIVVHPANPVQELARSQVQAIYNGRLTNWRDLGGDDRPITLISRERGSGARAIFRERIMVEQRVSINAVVLASQTAVLDAVAADPSAIGYAMLGSLRPDVRPLTLDGVAPAPVTTADQSYPLTVPLYFVSPAEPQGELRAFLAWLQAPAGQSLLGEKYGRVR